MSNDALAEKCVYAMTRAVDELIGNKKFQRLVLFFQRSDSGDGENSFHPKLFESINICAEVEFAGQEAMAASVTSEEGHFSSFECAQHVCIGWRSEWSFLRDLLNIGEAWHGIQSAAADDSNFCLRQKFASA